MIDFEHTLFMLLLLVAIFNARLPRRRLTFFLILGGTGLALLPPFLKFPIPWNLILNLSIPLLFWQNARRWVNAIWRVSWRELALWLATVASLTVVLSVTGYLSLPGAILFGFMAASMLWRAIEPVSHSTQFSQIGPLALIFLLTEVAPAVETPNRYLGGLFSGAAVGIAVGLLATFFVQRVNPERRGWIALFQIYLAYWLALAIDVSAVVAALLSVAVFVEGSLRREVKDKNVLLPEPTNSWVGFSLLLVLFVILGWQGHQPLTWTLLIEASLGLFIGLVIAWLGRIAEVAGFDEPVNIWWAGLRVGLFLFAAMLLWPRGMLLDPLQLIVALGIALIATVLSITILNATLSLQGERFKPNNNT
jgi:hypothetical protein